MLGAKLYSFATVKRWYNEFQLGRYCLNHSFQAQKLKMANTEKILTVFCYMIKEDLNNAVRNTQTTLSIGVEAISSILTQTFESLFSVDSPQLDDDRVRWNRSAVDRFDCG